MRRDYGSYYFMGRDSTRYYFKREGEPRYYFNEKGERYYFNQRGEPRYSFNQKGNQKGEPLNEQGIEDVKLGTYGMKKDYTKFYDRRRYSPLNEEDMENFRLDQQDITSLEYIPREAMFDTFPQLCAFYGAVILILVVSELCDNYDD